MSTLDWNVLIPMLWLAHVCANWFLVGLIWFVQVVHYPLMRDVGLETYCEYANRHTRQTTWVVAVPMLLEVFSLLVLLYHPPQHVPLTTLLIAVLMLAGIWIATALFSVPCHNKLCKGFDEKVHKKLVQTNWIRTVLWTMKALWLTSLYI